MDRLSGHRLYREMDPADGFRRICAALPIPVLDAAAWLLAWLWWWLLPIRRREAQQNLRAALPEHATDGGRRVLCRMMHDILLSYLELCRWDRLQVTVQGGEGLRAQAGPVLFGHLGAWDVGLLAIGDTVPTACFLRPPADPRARRFIAGLRDQHDVVRLEAGASLKDAGALISGGRSVLFVQDQRFNRGLEVEFFGRPALTSAAFAVCVLKDPARRAWTAATWREGPARHCVRIDPFPLPPLTGDREEDVRRITQATARWYEDRIRERPHGWLWLHRRWHLPPGQPPAKKPPDSSVAPGKT